MFSVHVHSSCSLFMFTSLHFLICGWFFSVLDISFWTWLSIRILEVGILDLPSAIFMLLCLIFNFNSVYIYTCPDGDGMLVPLGLYLFNSCLIWCQLRPWSGLHVFRTKIAFRAKVAPENFFLAKFSAKFSIFREIRSDSSIALSVRVVCKISGKSDFICQKQFFWQDNIIITRKQQF